MEKLASVFCLLLDRVQHPVIDHLVCIIIQICAALAISTIISQGAERPRTVNPGCSNIPGHPGSCPALVD